MQSASFNGSWSKATHPWRLGKPWANLVEVARLMAGCDMDFRFGLGLELIITGLDGRPQREFST